MDGSVRSDGSNQPLRTESMPSCTYSKAPRNYDSHGSQIDEIETQYLQGHTDREMETDTDPDDRLSMGRRMKEQPLSHRKNVRTVPFQHRSRWGNSSTVITSDGDEGEVSAHELQLDTSLDDGPNYARYIGPLIAGFFAVIAFFSPILMVVLPRFKISGWDPGICDVICEGSLLSLSFRLLFLLIGSWAVFLRKPKSTLPRVFVLRAIIIFFIFLISFVFWLFYGMHIFKEKVNDYDAIALYAVSFVDVLLFLHYLAVILLEIRQLQAQFVVKIVRSPDGESHSYTVGQMSIQSLAVYCLEQYYRDFQLFNPYLHNISRARPSATKFKVYNIDSCLTGNVLPDSSQSSVLSGRNQESEHNKRFYDEQNYKLKVERRRARLVTAAESAFAQIKQFNRNDCQQMMEANEAAQTIFPIFAKALQKYLSATRQRPRYTQQDVLRHLAICIKHDASPKAFLNRYLTQGSVVWSDQDYNKTQIWTLRSDLALSQSVQHGTTFLLYQRGISLLVVVRKLPHFNLTEGANASRPSRFILQTKSETRL